VDIRVSSTTDIFEEEKKLFQAEVLVDGNSVSKASGKNKKDASQRASKLAMELLNIG
jgi:dsRNA-specific ribonuclease